MRKALIRLMPAALAATLAVSGTEAPAAGIGECEEYVAVAIQAANEVQSRSGCGFDLNDPRWSTDPDVHKRWCRASNKESVDQESAARKSELDKCRNCNGYTANAVNAAKRARELDCGFSLDSPMWSLDPNVHNKWCMRDAMQTTTESETRVRDASVNSCQACRDYSNAALKAADDNEKFKCNFSGARWEKGGHYLWCMNSTEAANEMPQETAARESLIGECKAASTQQGLSKGRAKAPYTPAPKVRSKVDQAKRPTTTGTPGVARQGSASSSKSKTDAKAMDRASDLLKQGPATTGTAIGGGLTSGNRGGDSAPRSGSASGTTNSGRGSGTSSSGTIDFGSGGTGAPRGGGLR